MNEEVRQLKDQTANMPEEIEIKDQDIARGVEALHRTKKQSASIETRLGEMVSSQESIGGNDRDLRLIKKTLCET